MEGKLRSLTEYHIAGNFHFCELVNIRFSQRKLLRIACFCSTKGRHAPNFAKKTFAYSHKTAKFAKVFRYTVYETVFLLHIDNRNCGYEMKCCSLIPRCSPGIYNMPRFQGPKSRDGRSPGTRLRSILLRIVSCLSHSFA